MGDRARVLRLLVIVAAAACGKSQVAPSIPPAVTIIVAPTGVSPRHTTIPLGARVTFTNTDGEPHAMSSDPHPEHTDCPEINQVGYLLTGQTRETGNFVSARVCGFHDHNKPDIVGLQGTITIQ
jgi:hypothetical protein